MSARSRARTVLRPVYHRVLAPLPTDPTRRYTGTSTDGAPDVRMAYFGDCSFRAMDFSHGQHAPVGWPRVLGDRLLEQGARMEFSVSFHWHFGELPGRDDLDRYLRLTGDPDVVFVQTGAQYARRTVLADNPRNLRLREDIGRRLGRHVFAGYRVVRPVARVLGRQVTPYPGPECLAAFLAAVGECWPDALVAVIVPPRRESASPPQRAIEARVTQDIRATAARAGVECIDLTPLLTGPGLRCANGYNLSTAGARLAGDHLADWLLSRRTALA